MYIQCSPLNSNPLKMNFRLIQILSDSLHRANTNWYNIRLIRKIAASFSIQKYIHIITLYRTWITCRSLLSCLKYETMSISYLNHSQNDSKASYVAN